MANLFEKGMLAGLGLLDLSQEKLKEVVEELVARGEVSRKEGRSVIQNVMDRGQREKREVEKRLKAAAEKALEKMNVATRKDLEKLEKKIAKLEEKLSAK